MGRKRRGEGGEPRCIWIHDAEAQILDRLDRSGDGRSVSQIFCDALKSCHSDEHRDTEAMRKHAFELKAKYSKRSKSMIQGASTYYTMQLNWIDANLEDLQRIYPGKIAKEIYALLEDELKQGA